MNNKEIRALAHDVDAALAEFEAKVGDYVEACHEANATYLRRSASGQPHPVYERAGEFVCFAVAGRPMLAKALRLPVGNVGYTVAGVHKTGGAHK